MTVDESIAAGSEPRFVFTGRIHPERYGWHLDPGFEGNMILEGHRMKMTLSIHRAQLSIQLVGRYEGGIADLKNRLQDIAQGAVDALGFGYVAGLEVEIVSCVDPRGQQSLFAPCFDRLRPWPSELRPNEVADVRLLAIAAGESFGIRAALADLRQAVRAPADTLFYSYRAVESIRQELLVGAADDASARRDSWDELRRMAGVEEDDIRWLVPAATARRHGQLLDVHEDDRARAMALARQVVVAYARAARRNDPTVGDASDPPAGAGG